MSRENVVVIRYDSPDVEAERDVVYLHGTGSSEREAGWALPLFGRANVRSYRGPLIQGGGFEWFQNAGVGMALADSLAPETDTGRGWIAADTGGRRPWVWGVGNGGG